MQLSVQVSAVVQQAGGGLPLLGPTNLQYLGAFTFPLTSPTSESFQSGAMGMAFDDSTGRMFVCGHTEHSRVAEITIPTLGNQANADSLPVCGITQPLTPIAQKIPNLAASGVDRQHGLLVSDSNLIVCWHEAYDANPLAYNSHSKLSSKTLATATATPLAQVGPFSSGYVGGYMATIAPEHQAALGAGYATGLNGVSITDRTSCGPAAFGFDPQALSSGGAAIPAVGLLYYPSSNPLGPTGYPQPPHPLWNSTSKTNGVVFVRGTRTVLFIGSHGLGTTWYGNPGEQPPGVPDDTARTDKGYHAFPYAYQCWAYDVNDLAAVRLGQLQPWAVQPYACWTFTMPHQKPDARINGVTYDHAQQRIYISQNGAGAFGRVAVHCLGVVGI